MGVGGCGCGCWRGVDVGVLSEVGKSAVIICIMDFS